MLVPMFLYNRPVLGNAKAITSYCMRSPHLASECGFEKIYTLGNELHVSAALATVNICLQM